MAGINTIKKVLLPVEMIFTKNPFRGRNARQELEKFKAEAEHARRVNLLEKYKGDPIASKLTYDQLAIDPVWPAAIDFFSGKPLTALTFEGLGVRGRGTGHMTGLDIGRAISEAERKAREYAANAKSEGVREVANQLANTSAAAKIIENKANTYDAKHATSKVSGGVHQGRPMLELELGLSNLEFPDFTIRPRGYLSNLNSFKKYVRNMTDKDGNLSRYAGASDEEIEKVFFDRYGSNFNESNQFVGTHRIGGIINYLDYVK